MKARYSYQVQCYKGRVWTPTAGGVFAFGKQIPEHEARTSAREEYRRVVQLDKLDNTGLCYRIAKVREEIEVIEKNYTGLGYD